MADLQHTVVLANSHDAVQCHVLYWLTMHGLSFNEDHPEGKVFEHPVYKEHHGLLLQDFANTILCDRPDPCHSAIADQSIAS